MEILTHSDVWKGVVRKALGKETGWWMPQVAAEVQKEHSRDSVFWELFCFWSTPQIQKALWKIWLYFLLQIQTATIPVFFHQFPCFALLWRQGSCLYPWQPRTPRNLWTQCTNSKTVCWENWFILTEWKQIHPVLIAHLNFTKLFLFIDRVQYSFPVFSLAGYHGSHLIPVQRRLKQENC